MAVNGNKVLDRLYVTILAILIIGLLVKCQSVRADSVILGGVSYHFVSEDTTNSFHRAVIYNKGDYSVGYLRNSHDNDSFMGAYRVWGEVGKGITTDIYAGVVRGYERCYGDFKRGDTKREKVIACPLVLINATINTGTKVEPVISLWGDAIVLSGKVNF